MFESKLGRVLITSMTLFSTSLLACGDGSEDGGSGGEGSGMIGEPCTTSCVQGLICSNSAAFHGICSVQCGNDSSCQMFALEARCFGGGVAECALMCESNGDCPTGLTCKDVTGPGTPMACVH